MTTSEGSSPTPPKQSPVESPWDDEITIDFMRYWQVIRQRWKAVAICALVTALAGGFSSLFVSPRTWQSTARILLPQPLQGAGVGIVNAMPGVVGGGGGAIANLMGVGGSLADTYRAIIESDTFRESLVNALHLDELLQLKSREEQVSTVEGLIDMKPDPKSGMIAITATLSGTPQIRIFGMRSHSQWGHNDIEARQLSAAIANKTLELLQDYLNQSNIFQSRKYRVFVEHQRRKALAELTLARRQLQTFQKARKTISPSDETQSLMRTLQDFNQQKILADVTIRKLQDQIHTVTSQLRAEARTPLSLPADSPVVQQWRQKLIEQQTQLSVMQKELTDSHPDVVRLRLAIGETERQLRKEVARVMHATRTRLAPQLTDLVVQQIANESQSKGLASVISQLQDKLAAMPPKVMSFSELQGDVEVLERRYRLYADELEKARMAEAKDPTAFVLLDRAVPPNKKAGPSIKKNMLRGAMFGFILSVLAVLAVEQFNKGVPPFRATQDPPLSHSLASRLRKDEQ